jgi:hypothetical protein
MFIVKVGVKRMKRSIIAFVFVSLMIHCVGIWANSKEVDEAIKYSQPERLLKLSPQDLDDLIQNKEEYVKKAQETTAKVWNELHARFDWKDRARIVAGAGIVGLSAWFLHGLLKLYYPNLGAFLNKAEAQQGAQALEGEDRVLVIASPLDKQKILYTLMGGTAGSLLASLGILNIYHGFKKHDRFKKYYGALAVESNVKNWLALKLSQS